MMVIVLFAFLAILIVCSIPIAISLGLSSVGVILMYNELPMMGILQKIFNGVSSFTLMAVPFFILGGNIMSRGGVSRRLVNVADGVFGRITGGLSLVAIMASTFFGAISGSAPATTAAISGIMVDPMKQKGYDKDFTAAVVAAGGTIGLLIPPSVILVLYGVQTSTSISDLFIAGIVPGLFMSAALMIIAYIISKKRGYRGSGQVTIKQFLKSLVESIPALLMPVIILGGIYGGIFTPTESAVVAAVYGLIVGLFIYKELQWKDLPGIFLKTAKTTATITFLIAISKVFSHILVAERVPEQFAHFLLQLSSNPMVIQLIIMFALLIVGTFLSAVAAVALLVPIFFPIVTALGIDPVFFGVLMTFALAIGNITPPVGTCLFVASNVAKVQFEKVVVQIIPFIMILIVVLLALNFMPRVVLWLPSLS